MILATWHVRYCVFFWRIGIDADGEYGKRVETGTREGIMKDFREGKFDGVVAIWWTFDSSRVSDRRWIREMFGLAY